MTLPDENVLSILREHFVVGWRSIEREDYCGSSHGYGRVQTAVGTTNGAGGSNVQMFVLSPGDEPVVLHALPGFWHPDDLVRELRFALVMDRLWRDETRSRDEKERLFAQLHAHELRTQSELTTARSEWQGFDRNAELRRVAKGETRDTVTYCAKGNPTVKPLNVVMRERMAQRPFVPFAEFDTASYVDYGRKFYDNNQGHDRKGRTFRTLKKLMAKREYEAEKERKKAERLKRRQQRRSRTEAL